MEGEEHYAPALGALDVSGAAGRRRPAWSSSYAETGDDIVGPRNRASMVLPERACLAPRISRDTVDYGGWPRESAPPGASIAYRARIECCWISVNHWLFPLHVNLLR
jgi:hypothetical protein